MTDDPTLYVGARTAVHGLVCDGYYRPEQDYPATEEKEKVFRDEMHHGTLLTSANADQSSVFQVFP